MPGFSPFSRPPLAVVVTSHEWSSRTLGTVLTARGYSLLRLFQGSEALRRLGQITPDLLIIHRDLWDISAEELCRAVVERALITPNTPIALVGPSPWRNEDRVAALQAGAWEVVGLPVDIEQLMLRFDKWVRAKLYADGILEQSLLDADSQLYNARGVLRRLGEVSAGAKRHRRPLACIMLRPETADALQDESASALLRPQLQQVTPAPVSEEVCRAIGEALRALSRVSDAIGRLTDGDFIIIAPETDGVGAFGLAVRMKRALEAVLAQEGRRVRVRAACYAVSDASTIEPNDLLMRTAAALREEADGAQDTIRVIPVETPPTP